MVPTSSSSFGALSMHTLSKHHFVLPLNKASIGHDIVVMLDDPMSCLPIGDGGIE